MGIDGRELDRFWLTAYVKGIQIQPGPTADMWPNVMLIFYDDQRREIGSADLGRGEARLTGSRSVTRSASRRGPGKRFCGSVCWERQGRWRSTR